MIKNDMTLLRTKSEGEQAIKECKDILDKMKASIEEFHTNFDYTDKKKTQ